MYQCQDCTYKGKHFPGGVCPGCGSRRIRRLDTPKSDEAEPRTRRSYLAMLAWALWAYLLYVALGLAGFL